MTDPSPHAPDSAAPAVPIPRGPAYPTPSKRLEQERRSHRLLLLGIRLIFMVLLVTVTLLPFVGEITNRSEEGFSFWEVIGVFLATFTFGVVVLTIDALTPNKKIGTVFGVYLGIVAGLVGALAVGALIDLVAESWDLTRNEQWQSYIGLIKLAIGIALCYLAISIVLTTKDDFRLVIPYVEFARQMRGVRPLLLDTSVLIDGRIDAFGQTGFLDAPLVVPQFVINELQTLADSGDKLKRARGRRGLTAVSKLQANPYVDMSIDEAGTQEGSVDHLLLATAREQNLRIATTDYNLNKVAQIHGVTVLNINDLANTVKAQVIPGETLVVEIVKRGESAEQGVGYLPDGTMVVVEDAADRVGHSVELTVTNSLQTTAGRMVFGRTAEDERSDEPPPPTQRIAHAATHQPRATDRPELEPPDTRRNPRR